MSDDRKSEAKRLYLEEGWTQAAIAQHFGVSTRTVERWAEKDGWGCQKRVQKVVPISSAKPHPVNQSDPPPHHNPPSIRPRRQSGKIDEAEIVDSAIVSLDGLLASMCGCGDGIVDTRGIGGVAGALVRLLEYRRKIQPPTAADLAELAIALNLRPEEFMQALREAWRLRA